MNSSTNARRIAFMDFDGTITTKDTLLEIIKFQKGNFEFYKGMLRLSPYILGMKFRTMTNEIVKEKVISYFFGGMQDAAFQEQCDAFIDKTLPGLLRPGALDHLTRLRETKTTVVIVTASFSNWIKKWTQEYGFDLISSELEISDGKLTGKIFGRNCRSIEKVRRIKEKFDLSEFDHISCYGDTEDDRPMLALGQYQYFKPFR